eukprot:3236201-Karenia_brevis.AAC.1
MKISSVTLSCLPPCNNGVAKIASEVVGRIRQASDRAASVAQRNNNQSLQLPCGSNPLKTG